MMAHLGVLQDEHSDAVSKYLEDHPDPRARVAHLMGYPELDPSTVTPAQKLVQASSDEERARYDFARAAARRAPQDRSAQLRSAARARAIRTRPRASEQERANVGGGRTARHPATRATAKQRIAALRQMEVQRVTLTKPNLPKLQSPWSPRRPRTLRTRREIQARATEGKDQLKAVQSRLETLQYEDPGSEPDQRSPRLASRSDREESQHDDALGQQRAAGCGRR